MAMKIEKVLSCICVVMILMSVVPVSVFAVDSGTKNASGKYNSFQDSNERVSSMQGGQEVKFIGTAIKYNEVVDMPGNYPWWDVSVDEIISGPSELKGHTVSVSFFTLLVPGSDPCGYMDPNIKSGDKVEVYGWYHGINAVTIYPSDDYYIRVEEKKPDLIIKDISWSPSNPNMGDTITFTVKIKNQGSGSAGSSTVKYYISLSYVDFDSVPSLSAGSTSTQTFTWTADKCGDLTVTAKADANSAVTESNECNNDRTEGTNIFCEETKPVPKVTKVGIDPSTCVKEEEYATISVTVANNGGASSEGYISVSFPNDEDVYVVSGTGNEYNKVYQKDKDLIWNSAGVQMKAVDPLVELYDSDWEKYQQEFITMNVKPNSGSDEIVFYVRAALKNDADGDYERDPTYSGYKDQQGWYVKKYSVDVCEYEKVKIRGKIIADLPIISYYSFDVKIDEVLDDPTGNLQEGETVNVYGHRDGPAQVDDVTVGDEVEVYGEYRGYGGEYKQIFLSEWGDSSSDHYVKNLPSDIIIENINLEPTNLVAGEPVDIEIIVINKGKGKYVSPGNTHVDIKAIDKNNLIYGSAINEWESIEWNIGDLEVGERSALIFEDFIFNIPYLAESLRVDLILAGDGDARNNFLEVSILQVRHNDDDFYKCMIDGVLICLTSGVKTTAALKKAGKVVEAIKQTFSSAQFYEELVEDLRQGRYEVFFSKIAKNKAEVIAQGDWGSGLIGNIKAKAAKAYEFFDVFKNIIETGIACANVFEFYVDILEGWIRGGEDGGISSSGVVGASPIYILVEDEYGSEAGYDPSGAKKEEIEGSLVFTCDHFKTVLIPGKMDNKKVTVVGSDSEVAKSSKTISSTADGGTDSSFTLSIVESSKTVIYEDVPVNPQTIGTIEINENNPEYYLDLDYDGDGTTDDTVKPSSIKTIGCTYDHDGDGIVEDDIDDLIMATDAYLGFNTGTEYDADGDGIVEDDIGDLIMATDAYLGFITCEEEGR